MWHGDGAGRHRHDQDGGGLRPLGPGGHCLRHGGDHAVWFWSTACLVTKIKLPPFIVTLGTLNIAFAATQLYSGAQTITPTSLRACRAGQHLPVGADRHRLGRGADAGAVPRHRVCAARNRAWPPCVRRGQQPEATRLTGIATDKVLLGVYVLAGLFYGIASLLSVARTGAGDPNAGRPKTSTPSAL